MKKLRWVLVFCIVLGIVPALTAQSLKGMSLNGNTGLYSIPSGRIGWERTSDLGLDFGYHTVIDEDTVHIPAFALSLFKWVELSGAFDIQPGDDMSDFLTGFKVQFPVTDTAIAVGGNLQIHNLGHDDEDDTAFQIYLAVTYAGTFFDMPAETTVVLGKTFVEDSNSSDIDFGMGFDLVLLPNVLQRYVHWVTDFANFSYSTEAGGANRRGVLNTGVRIDLSVIPALNKFKFAVDVLLTDAFDSERSFSLGAVFGIPIL
jgi:hypothetical protein